ncbi:MAG: FHA domain-containing protein [Lachnospiraceae bacterium]|nr:FHA domain-containing protein [Lachnospiraceae bacterium]
MKRRVPIKILLPLFALLLSLLPLQSLAVGYLTVALKRAIPADNMLLLLAGVDASEAAEQISMEVEIDGNRAETPVLTTVLEADIGISYLILVDVSGSMSANNRAEIETALSVLIDGMREKDNAAISFMGEQIEACAFTQDKDALRATLAQMPKDAAYTNLYYGIYHGLRILEDQNDAQPEKCLVVISDGENTGAAGITQAEAEQKIDASRISVCTIGVSAAGNKKMQESEKLLGSFARRSAGGLHQVIGQEAASAQEAAENVMRRMQSALVIGVDLTGYEAKQDAAKITLRASSEAHGSTEDMLTVPSAVLLEAKRTPDSKDTGETAGSTGVTDDAAQGSTDTAGADTAEAGSPHLPLILIAGGILLGILGAVLMARTRKRKREEEEAAKIAAMHVREGVKLPEQKEEREKKEGPPVKRLRLVKVGLVESAEHEVEVKGSFVIGRSQEADFVLPEQRVSARHCKLEYDGNRLTVTDLQSTNGTLVNGIPVTHAFLLQDQDILTIGGSEWRISM